MREFNGGYFFEVDFTASPAPKLFEKPRVSGYPKIHVGYGGAYVMPEKNEQKKEDAA